MELQDLRRNKHGIKSTHEAGIDILCSVNFPLLYVAFIFRHPKHSGFKDQLTRSDLCI